MVVLLMGARYGDPQTSGLSATHEEYREARERKPVLLFVERDVTREPAQQAFLDEADRWATGHFRAFFSTPDELMAAVLRALHDHELAQTAGRVDEAEIRARAEALLPDRHGTLGAGSQLTFAVAGGPSRQVLRPAELERRDLSRDIQHEALFGDFAVFDISEGTRAAIRGTTLVVEQRSSSVILDQAGSIAVVQPARRESDRREMELPVLFEEEILAAVACAIRFSGWLLDRVDPLRRISDVVPVVSLSGVSYQSWRTRAEHAASPNSGTISQIAGDIAITLTPARRHRQALTHDADRMAEDMIVLLRRAIRG